MISLKKTHIKPGKRILPLLLSISIIGFVACNNNNNDTVEGTSPGVGDTTLGNPTNDALDAYPDQRQHIPVTDSSNVAGTDTISGAEATPNTGTEKTYNAQKDTSK